MWKTVMWAVLGVAGMVVAFAITFALAAVTVEIAKEVLRMQNLEAVRTEGCR